MNPESPDIVEYFRSHNSDLNIIISTNGSARTAEFWQRLAQSRAEIMFCLDGLADTHHLYRQNTNWHTIIKNAEIFINSGGRAIWKFIKFDHNNHQIDQCRALSRELGFAEFTVLDDGRNTAPVFDKRGNLTHVLGDYSGETDFKILFHKKTTDQILLEDITPGRLPKSKISCATQLHKSIYVAANGEVSPCCHTGFYPKTYGHGQYHEAANAQLIPLIQKNNALEYPLSECIDWFSNITACWNKSSYESGRLVICDDICGS
jgi:sulfatase maturation enzyme AslB (radical SAM superfamily)